GTQGEFMIKQGLQALLAHDGENELRALRAQLETIIDAANGIEGGIAPFALGPACQENARAAMAAKEEAELQQAWHNQDRLGAVRKAEQGRKIRIGKKRLHRLL